MLVTQWPFLHSMRFIWRPLCNIFALFIQAYSWTYLIYELHEVVRFRHFKLLVLFGFVCPNNSLPPPLFVFVIYIYERQQDIPCFRFRFRFVFFLLCKGVCLQSSAEFLQVPHDVADRKWCQYLGGSEPKLCPVALCSCRWRENVIMNEGLEDAAFSSLSPLLVSVVFLLFSGVRVVFVTRFL